MKNENPYSPPVAPTGKASRKEMPWLAMLFFIIPLALVIAMGIAFGSSARTVFDLVVVGLVIVIAVEFARITFRLPLEPDNLSP